MAEKDGAEEGKGSSSKPGVVGKAEEALKKLNLGSMIGKKEETKMENHKFWQTQPVPRYGESSADQDGPIEPEAPDKVPKQPLALLDGFEWVVIDIENDKEVDDVYQLLYYHYVEDDAEMFRFRYSPAFLRWALKAPGWRQDWHIGIRATQSKKLVAFISGVPITLRVRANEVKCSEVNFLCVHKKLRAKRLAPVLIREVTRRCHVNGIWQAIYTVGHKLPTPVSTCLYYHRSLDWDKLNDVGFTHLPIGSTKARQIAKYKLPEKPLIKGLRAMESRDIPAVLDLLQRYLQRMDVAQVFTEDDVKHWLLDEQNTTSEKVVYAFVVETDNKITDFISFYALESSVIGNQQHPVIRAAYLFYYATEVAFKSDAKGNELLQKRLNELMHDGLIHAKKANFDVFNALTMLDNNLFLKQQLFGAGTGQLNYYLYNWRTAPIAGGIDSRNVIDEKNLSGVGIVML